MAKTLGIEHIVSTLDGDVELAVLFPDHYPVAFENLKEPEPWESIVTRHKQELTDDNRGEQ
jgi:hypothetical protein